MKRHHAQGHEKHLIGPLLITLHKGLPEMRNYSPRDSAANSDLTGDELTWLAHLGCDQKNDMVLPAVVCVISICSRVRRGKMASNFHSCLAESRGSFLFGMFPSSMYYIGHFAPQCPLGYPGEESGCST